MSFSASVKEELSKINIFSNEEIVKAEIYGYLLTIDMQKRKTVFLTENEYNINRLSKLLNRLKVKYDIKMKGRNFAIEFKKEEVTFENLNYENELLAKGIVRGAFLRKRFNY